MSKRTIILDDIPASGDPWGRCVELHQQMHAAWMESQDELLTPTQRAEAERCWHDLITPANHALIWLTWLLGSTSARMAADRGEAQAKREHERWRQTCRVSRAG